MYRSQNYIELDELEIIQIDFLPHANLEKLCKEIVIKSSGEDFKKMRPKEYWEIHSRYFKTLTRRHNKLKLFLYAYIVFKNNQNPNWNHLKNTIEDERPRIKNSIKPNTKFYENYE